MFIFCSELPKSKDHTNNDLLVPTFLSVTMTTDWKPATVYVIVDADLTVQSIVIFEMYKFPGVMPRVIYACTELFSPELSNFSYKKNGRFVQ